MRRMAIRYNMCSAWIFSLAFLMLAGCDTELYSDLGQREANEISAALEAQGIGTRREKDRNSLYTVFIDKDHFASAVNILEDQGLPRKKFQNLCDVFSANGGWAPSPIHERARMTCALGEEFSHTISQIEGISNARVHLVLPSFDRLARERSNASASVAVHYRPEIDPATLSARIKQLVANGVEGLEYERVSVALFPEEPKKPLLDRPSPDAAHADAGNAATGKGSFLYTIIDANTENRMLLSLAVGAFGALVLVYAFFRWLLKVSVRRREAGRMPVASPSSRKGESRIPIPPRRSG